jgi:hypothetical protein
MIPSRLFLGLVVLVVVDDQNFWLLKRLADFLCRCAERYGGRHRGMFRSAKLVGDVALS